MFELIKQLMDYSFAVAPGQEGKPVGFLFFVFIALSAITVIWISYYIFDFLKDIMANLTTWRSNVAESRAKSKKNDMNPVLKDGIDDALYKIDKLSEELKEGITHLSKK
jgi:hypothetical protein